MFRGAVLHVLEGRDDLLFHNHEEDGLRYAYPLIQYKRIRKKAAIVCVEEGADAIGQFFANCHFVIQVGEREMALEIENIKAEQIRVQLWEDEFAYHLRKWLPLNQENYQQYKQLESLAEKYAFLEQLLTGNILSFLKGVNIFLDKPLVCKITEVDAPRLTTYKNTRMMSFDVEFKSNITLPDFIGLGKGVSLGFGVVTRNTFDKNNIIK